MSELESLSFGLPSGKSSDDHLKPPMAKKLDLTSTLLLLTMVVSQSAFGYYISLSNTGRSSHVGDICWTRFSEDLHRIFSETFCTNSFCEFTALMIEHLKGLL